MSVNMSEWIASLEESSSPSTPVPLTLTTSAPGLVYRYFHYNPSVAAAVIFLILYLLATLASIFPTVRYGKGSRFMLIVVGTGVAEVIGFATRIYLANNVDNPDIKPLSTYVVMSSLLIISPNALALVNYMIISRIILIASSFNIHPLYSLLRSSIVTPIFLTSDILSFAIQGSASSLIVKQSTSNLGEMVMISGLVLQICFFSVFTLITGIIQFHPHYRPLHTVTATAAADLSSHSAKLARVMKGVWITITLLFVRSFYRLIEFGSGFDGPVATVESLMYLFDSLPVLLCFVFYYWGHFGLINSLFLRAEMDHQPLLIEASPTTASKSRYQSTQANGYFVSDHDRSGLTNVVANRD